MCFVVEADKRGDTIGVEDEISGSSSSSEKTSKREMSKWVGKENEDKDEDGGSFLPQVGEFTRTNTDVTLVDGSEESEESGEVALKELKFVSVDDQAVRS